MFGLMFDSSVEMAILMNSYLSGFDIILSSCTCRQHYTQDANNLRTQMSTCGLFSNRNSARKSTGSSGLTLQHSISPCVRVGITCFIK